LAEIDIQTEEELPRGWRYTVRISKGGAETVHTVTLSWADHEFWSGGMAAPSKVLEAVVRFAVERRGELPERFDASTVRRWYPEVDEGLVF
jgi:hypothetical protein